MLYQMVVILAIAAVSTFLLLSFLSAGAAALRRRKSR